MLSLCNTLNVHSYPISDPNQSYKELGLLNVWFASEWYTEGFCMLHASRKTSETPRYCVTHTHTCAGSPESQQCVGDQLCHSSKISRKTTINNVLHLQYMDMFTTSRTECISSLGPIWDVWYGWSSPLQRQHSDPWSPVTAMGTGSQWNSWHHSREHNRRMITLQGNERKQINTCNPHLFRTVACSYKQNTEGFLSESNACTSD